MTESVSLAMCSNVPSSLCDLFWPQFPSEKNVVNTCVSLAHGYLGGLNEVSAERLLQKLKAWANSREDCGVRGTWIGVPDLPFPSWVVLFDISEPRM